MSVQTRHISTLILGWSIIGLTRLLLMTVRYRSSGDAIDESGVVAFLATSFPPPGNSDPNSSPWALSKSDDFLVTSFCWVTVRDPRHLITFEVELGVTVQRCRVWKAYYSGLEAEN